MPKTTTKEKTAIVLSNVSNDAEDAIIQAAPYMVEVTIRGSSDILFHRWSNEDVAAKAAAAKGSAAKKTDNIEAYVFRNEKGNLCLPGEYLRGSLVAAAKFRQDPRSSRKSMSDLMKAAIVVLTNEADLGVSDWDYIDQRRVQVQRNGVTRSRPALREGWEATFTIMVNLPEYLSPTMLLSVLNDAGRFVGVGDFRPTFGRFQVVKFEELDG